MQAATPTGLSPPTRGNTLSSSPSGCGTRDYPRPRGEPDYPFFDGWGWYGLPPPPRGIRVHRDCVRLRRGPTPAPAGNPHPRLSPIGYYRAYPRPRGEPYPLSPIPCAIPGLPPPTRGILRLISLLPLHPWSTPAHAGNTRELPRIQSRLWAYPRPHGEPYADMAIERWECGLPPPPRGTLCQCALFLSSQGATPTHAGNPGIGLRRWWVCRDYPHLTRGILRMLRTPARGCGSTPAPREEPQNHTFTAP